MVVVIDLGSIIVIRMRCYAREGTVPYRTARVLYEYCTRTLYSSTVAQYYTLINCRTTFTSGYGTDESGGGYGQILKEVV